MEEPVDIFLSSRFKLDARLNLSLQRRLCRAFAKEITKSYEAKFSATLAGSIIPIEK